MPKLFYHNHCMYLGIAKSGTTSVEKAFRSIKNRNSLEIPNQKDFSKEYFASIESYCDQLKTFVLFFHVREPWDRFLSAVATDIKRSPRFAKQKNKRNFILRRCQEIKDAYQHINTNDPDSVEASGINPNFYGLFESVYKSILLTMIPLSKKIKKIEIWNHTHLNESIEKNWQLKLLYRENKTKENIKNIITKCFESDLAFKWAWREKNCKDYELYNLVYNRPVHSISCKEYIKKFYEKL